MSSIYDNWERLVNAVLDREELRRLALLSSRETSFNSFSSTNFHISPYNSRLITLLDYVTGSLTDRVIKAARNAVVFKQECSEIKSKAENLAGMLRRAARASNDLYDRPTRRIVSDTEFVLEKALKLVMKCSRHGMKRVFNIIPANAFQEMSSLLENSIQDVSWLLSIYAPSDHQADEDLIFPLITINERILCLVWEQITTLYTGSLEDRSDAAATLASLARGSDQHGKLIIKEGGVGPLLKLVEEGSLEGQENATKAIGWLGKDPENVECMMGSGVPQVFVKMLKEGPMKVQAVVAWAVSELAMHYPRCQNLFAQHGVIAVLVSHLAFETPHEVVTSNRAREMEYPITKAHMKEMAARALWQLAKGNSTICISITESIAIPCFAELLEEQVRCNSSMVLVEIIAMAEKNPQLRRLAFNPNSPNCKALVGQLHGVLEKAEDPQLLIFCIKIVEHFATTLEEIETRMMISPLVKLMRHTVDKVSREACIVLTNLCSENYPSQDHSKEIRDAGGVSCIIHLLYFGEDVVQPYALFLLCYIAINSGQFAEKRVLNALIWASGQPSLREVAAVGKLLPEAIRVIQVALLDPSGLVGRGGICLL